MLKTLGLVTFAGTALLASTTALVLPTAAATVPPETFRTNARFAVDEDVLALSAAVALVEPNRALRGASWLHVYFYAFPLTVDDVDGVMGGTIAGLERKRMAMVRTARDANRSRAVLHFVIEQNGVSSNAALEVPGITCTIGVEQKDVAKGFPAFAFDGHELALQGSGRSQCDFTSVGMKSHTLTWNVDLHVPVFQKR